MDSRGVYSIISTFMLVVIIVFVMLFLSFMGSSSILAVEVGSKQAEPLQQNNAIREKITGCWHDFSAQAMESVDGNSCLTGQIAGYSIEKLGFLGCSGEKWKFGTVDGSSCKRKFPYLISIGDHNSGRCLGKMVLCYGK
ncbi:MAG TPA: hypothetical protein HA254_04320 [Candidatus Diapherotrites archaeon]|uniref:Uncharacterized protein n=1 Tax=Candidatus Iainarchaeum sp. TaxID=3101447 RepID=A0A7J4J046_9ARCH|nr:hypothetical protein [Candidatus Diapherotrites archaeon]